MDSEVIKHGKHRRQVRIIGGSHRSRVVRFHDGEGLRPSADAVREKLFNWLGQRLDGQDVLDLFAGSGVMGFEAASRGAARVVLVESAARAAADITANLAALDLPAAVLWRGDALNYLRDGDEKFDVVFLDPPYAWQAWAQLWTLLPPRLNPHAAVYIEAAADIPLPPSFIPRKSGQSGISRFVLADYLPDAL